MSLIKTKLRTEMQLRLDALPNPSTPDVILNRATEAVKQGLDLAHITAVLNAAILLVDDTTTDDEMFDLNAACLAIEPKQTSLFTKKQTFTISGNFTVPEGVYDVWVTLVGGGSSGGRAYGTGNYGHGGNSGGVLVREKITVVPGQFLIVAVGMGSTNSGAGGNTSINALVVSGGLYSQVAAGGDLGQLATSNRPGKGGVGFSIGELGAGAGAGGNGSDGQTNSYGPYYPGNDGIVIIEWF